MRSHPTHTHGGGRDQTAVIGHAPESRDWQPGDAAWQPVIAPTARIEAYVTIDAGVKRSTRIGDSVWLLKHVHIGHDCIIGDRCELSPGVVIGGFAELGYGVRVGMNATVRNRVKIGDGARIGMGAVVVTDVPAGETWVGNPARKLR